MEKRILSLFPYIEGNTSVVLNLKSIDIENIEKGVEELELKFGADNFINKFNKYGQSKKNEFSQSQNPSDDLKIFEKFKDLSISDFEALKSEISYQKILQWARQIEYGGTSLLALWYMRSSKFLFPQQNYGYYLNFNYFIDTFDVTGVFKNQDLEIDDFADAKNPVKKIVSPYLLTNQTIPTDKAIQESLLDVNVSADVQLELTLEEPFVKKIEELQKAGQDASFHIWFYSQIQKTQELLNNAKKDRVMKIMNDKSFADLGCESWSWKATDGSKVEKSIQQLYKTSLLNKPTQQ